MKKMLITLLAFSVVITSGCTIPKEAPHFQSTFDSTTVVPPLLNPPKVPTKPDEDKMFIYTINLKKYKLYLDQYIAALDLDYIPSEQRCRNIELISTIVIPELPYVSETISDKELNEVLIAYIEDLRFQIKELNERINAFNAKFKQVCLY